MWTAWPAALSRLVPQAQPAAIRPLRRHRKDSTTEQKYAVVQWAARKERLGRSTYGAPAPTAQEELPVTDDARH